MLQSDYELLISAEEHLDGQHGGDSLSNVASALDSVVEFLKRKEVIAEYDRVGDEIDKVQHSKGGAELLPGLMVYRDRVLKDIMDLGVERKKKTGE